MTKQPKAYYSFIDPETGFNVSGYGTALEATAYAALMREKNPDLRLQLAPDWELKTDSRYAMVQHLSSMLDEIVAAEEAAIEEAEFQAQYEARLDAQAREILDGFKAEEMPSNEDFDSDEERAALARHERECEGAWLTQAERFNGSPQADADPDLMLSGNRVIVGMDEEADDDDIDAWIAEGERSAAASYDEDWLQNVPFDSDRERFGGNQ